MIYIYYKNKNIYKKVGKWEKEIKYKEIRINFNKYK